MLNKSVKYLVLCVLIHGCGHTRSTHAFLSSGISDDFSNIADPKVRWAAYKLNSYVIEQQPIAMILGDTCEVVVLNKKIVDLIRKTDGKSLYPKKAIYYKTVEQLFAFVDSSQANQCFLKVQYDPQFGFPCDVYVDCGKGVMTDVFEGYVTEHLRRIVQ